MAKFKDKFTRLAAARPAANRLGEQALATLEEQFKDLREKVKAGEYSVEAEQEIKKSWKGTTNTLLYVTIRPNGASGSVRSMEFAFDYKDKKSGAGTYHIDFKIEAANGIFMPTQQIEKAADKDVSGFLHEVRTLGREKIAGDYGTLNQQTAAVIKNSIQL